MEGVYFVFYVGRRETARLSKLDVVKRLYKCTLQELNESHVIGFASEDAAFPYHDGDRVFKVPVSETLFDFGKEPSYISFFWVKAALDRDKVKRHLGSWSSEGGLEVKKAISGCPSGSKITAASKIVRVSLSEERQYSAPAFNKRGKKLPYTSHFAQALVMELDGSQLSAAKVSESVLYHVDRMVPGAELGTSYLNKFCLIGGSIKNAGKQ